MWTVTRARLVIFVKFVTVWPAGRMSLYISQSRGSGHKERLVHFAELSRPLSTQHRLSLRVRRAAVRAGPRQIRLLRRRRNCSQVRTFKFLTSLDPRLCAVDCSRGPWPITDNAQTVSK